MDSNLQIFTREFEELKGQIILCHDHTYRFIGLADDDEDYYYVLYDGRKLHLTTCLSRITPLKGYIKDADYKEMIRLAKLNHYDQPGLWNAKEDLTAYNEAHKKELVSSWTDGTRFIEGPHWELS